MKVIAHRGASSLELENTASSLKRALNIGVDAIEIDVRLTKDRHPVLCHDADFETMSSKDIKIKHTTLKQLRAIPLLDGSTVLTLNEALKLAGSTPLIIELKESGCARRVLNTIDHFPKASVTIASFKLGELTVVHDINPNIPVYGLNRTQPLDAIHLAQILGLSGVGLNYWILNPLTYLLARRAKLKMYVYTVNNAFIGKFIGWLYPQVLICTDKPHLFVKSRRKSRRKS